MKIRADTLTVSSIIFTAALLIPLPAMLGNAWTVPQARLDIAGRMYESNYYAPIGFVSLAIIIVGLIVIWGGYINGVRWTWFVMFVITWAWAFPVFVLAEFHWRNMLPIAQWPPLVLGGRGPQLGFAESVVTFLLMVVALALPVKAFIRGDHGVFRGMKIRRDAVTLFSIIFTVALLMATPYMINWARVTHQARFQDISSYPEAGIAPNQVVIPNYYAPVGIASLAIIAIGLVVTWAGYIKRVRWTWFVMFVIVWLWAFPVWVLPLVWPGMTLSSVTQWLRAAFVGSEPDRHMARTSAVVILMFLVMVIALIIPAKTFIQGRAVGPVKSGGRNSGAPAKPRISEP